MASPFRISSRLKDLGRYNKDLIPELAKRDMKVSPPELSVALAGLSQSPKSMNIVSAANEIVSCWEQEQAKTS